MQVIYLCDLCEYIGLVSKNKLYYFFALGNSELASCPQCTFLKFKPYFNFQDEVNPLKAGWVVGFNTSLIRKMSYLLNVCIQSSHKVTMTHNIKIKELCRF
jgi:hypothetical protein